MCALPISTPSILRSSSCTPQKQPPARIAFSFAITHLPSWFLQERLQPRALPADPPPAQDNLPTRPPPSPPAARTAAPPSWCHTTARPSRAGRQRTDLYSVRNGKGVSVRWI